jgi:4-hydroxy-2-oxoheptanedioate aldolase
VELSYPQDADPYLEMGVKHFYIGWDVEILHGWWQANGRQMRELLGAERLG